MRRTSSVTTRTRIAIPLVLLAAGIVELIITIMVVTQNPSAWTLTAMNLPSSFLPVTLAVVFATFAPAGKGLRAIIAIAAIAFAGVRLGLVVALFATRPDANQWLLGVVSGSQTNQISLGISVVTGSLLGLALAAWACFELIQPAVSRSSAQRSPTSRSSAQQHAASQPPAQRQERPGHVKQAPPPARHRPVVDAPSRETPWSEGATPWPRRVEEDSDGTLIRPPRSSG